MVDVTIYRTRYHASCLKLATWTKSLSQVIATIVSRFVLWGVRPTSEGMYLPIGPISVCVVAVLIWLKNFQLSLIYAGTALYLVKRFYWWLPDI